MILRSNCFLRCLQINPLIQNTLSRTFKQRFTTSRVDKSFKSNVSTRPPPPLPPSPSPSPATGTELFPGQKGGQTGHIYVYSAETGAFHRNLWILSIFTSVIGGMGAVYTYLSQFRRSSLGDSKIEPEDVNPDGVEVDLWESIKSSLTGDFAWDLMISFILFSLFINLTQLSELFSRRCIRYLIYIPANERILIISHSHHGWDSRFFVKRELPVRRVYTASGRGLHDQDKHRWLPLWVTGERLPYLMDLKMGHFKEPALFSTEIAIDRRRNQSRSS